MNRINADEEDNCSPHHLLSRFIGIEFIFLFICVNPVYLWLKFLQSRSRANSYRLGVGPRDKSPVNTLGIAGGIP
jgi:hypothetical protein